MAPMIGADDEAAREIETQKQTAHRGAIGETQLHGVQ